MPPDGRRAVGEAARGIGAAAVAALAVAARGRIVRPVRIADLPWYDLDEIVDATDAWWRGIAWHLRRLGVDRVPEQLSRDGSHVDRWQHPQLLLSQACGYDVIYDAADDIVPIATPCYAAEGCEGPRYRSIVVVRGDRPWRTLADLRGSRVAVNEAASHSGTNALRSVVAPLSREGVFFGDVQVTGSHTDSIAAVRAGIVDVACIDTIVLALLRRTRPAVVRGLRPIVCTASALAPPYVTSTAAPTALRRILQQALYDAVRDPALAGCRRLLLLDDFVFLPAASYAELEAFEEPALAAMYFELPAPARSPLARAGIAAFGRGTCGGRRGLVAGG